MTPEEYEVAEAAAIEGLNPTLATALIKESNLWASEGGSGEHSEWKLDALRQLVEEFKEVNQVIADAPTRPGLLQREIATAGFVKTMKLVAVMFPEYDIDVSHSKASAMNPPRKGFYHPTPDQTFAAVEEAERVAAIVTKAANEMPEMGGKKPSKKARR